jgi:hypothetical protein
MRSEFDNGHMANCQPMSTDPEKHLGPFEVSDVAEHESGRITNEICRACRGIVRRVQGFNPHSKADAIEGAASYPQTEQ